MSETLKPCPIPDHVKADPEYADGYFAAFHGNSFDTDRAGSETYAWGFEAGARAVQIFTGNGFERNRSGFSIRLRTSSASKTNV